MKLLHTSDWHLGITAGKRSLAPDQRFFFNQLYEIIERENIGAVLLSGDVYDSSVTNADSIELYNEAVTKICLDLKCPMIVIAGNHDSGPRLASCRKLLKSAGLFVTGKLTRDIEPVMLDEGKTAVYPIPFFNRDEVCALFPEKSEEIRTTEEAFVAVCDNIRKSMDKNIRNIVLSHAYITGAVLSESDTAARVGQAAAVSKQVFEGFDYVALGHIHKPQKVSDNAEYSGSPMKFSFGAEEKQEKGVIIIDTEDMSRRFLPVSLLHDRRTIKGSYEELLTMEEVEDCYIKAEVTDRMSGMALFAQLSVKFPLLLELRGISGEGTGSALAITVDELEKLDETEIMKRFLSENHEGYAPNERQLEIFRQAVEEAGKESDRT